LLDLSIIIRKNDSHTSTATLERVHDYYGLVMDLSSLKKMLNVFESVSKGEMEIPHERMSEFLEKHKLLDLRSMEKVKI
jgi:hypothetical protein